MKYISGFFNDEVISMGLSPEIKKIIIKLRNSLQFTKDNEKDIYNLLQENTGNNIIIYSQYVNILINSSIINNSLLNLLNTENKEKINNYWRCLSRYEEYTKFFEQELIKDLEQTKFDYSVVSLGVIDIKNEENYKLNLWLCLYISQRI